MMAIILVTAILAISPIASIARIKQPAPFVTIHILLIKDPASHVVFETVLSAYKVKNVHNVKMDSHLPIIYV